MFGLWFRGLYNEHMTRGEMPVTGDIEIPFNAQEVSPTSAETMEDPHDECGVFGIWAPGQGVIQKTIQGMVGLQHRGHSGAGLAYVMEDIIPANGAAKPVMIHKGFGSVSEAIPQFYRPDAEMEFDITVYDKLMASPVAIGHTRYSTAESEDFDALHPHLMPKARGTLAHNGELTNAWDVAWDFGVSLPEDAPDSDTFVLASVLDTRAVVHGDMVVAMQEVLKEVNGAYCLTVIDNKNRLIAARDPWGFHPLVIGELPGGKGFVVASESVALKDVGATPVRSVEPGEIVAIDERGITSSWIDRREERRFCSFEGIYTAREDGEVEGIVVREWRKNLGRFLAEDQPVPEGCIVVGVPATGLPTAEGFAEVSGLKPVRGAIVKREGAPRTFQMRGDKRLQALLDKFDFNEDLIRGADIALNDDSTIKGHTHRLLIKILKENYGARSVHLRLSSYPYRNPCFMGMDTHNVDNLVAARMSMDELADYLGADSVAYNTPERVQEAADRAAVSGKAGRLCTACFTGNEYPFKLPRGVVTVGPPTVREFSGVGRKALSEIVAIAS